MGKDARRMTRLSAVIVLVGSVSSMAAGVAFANATRGVNVPDSTFRQGTGTQEIDISIAQPAVGGTEALVIWPMYNSNDHWLLGVIADRSTGARCGYDAGQWQCAPGYSGWRAGDLRVQVSTAQAMDCGLAPGECAKDEIEVQAVPYSVNPMGGGPRSGPPISASGSVVIMPNLLGWSASATPAPSAPVYRAPVITSGAAAPRTSSVPAAAASPSVSATAASSAALVPSAAPSPTSIDAENTSLTTRQSSDSVGLYLALLIPVLLGVAVPFGYGARRRRREREIGSF